MSELNEQKVIGFGYSGDLLEGDLTVYGNDNITVDEIMRLVLEYQESKKSD